ncbi:MAG: DUF433 domain-containing protein [Planctomycetes bacterium]|nr:DUF433 domain-containing protein [Planctomycetota bacterium]
MLALPARLQVALQDPGLLRREGRTEITLQAGKVAGLLRCLPFEKKDFTIRSMSKLDYRNIEKVPGRCGGRAVVAGTRIRVAVVLACYRQGMTVEEILKEYPHLRPADVHDALAYAYEHAEEIEADLAADDEQTAQSE